jgi:hypothetical protein
MIRLSQTALAVACVLALVSGLGPAWAQSSEADDQDGRFTFYRVDDGHLRLDGRTGQVSICTRRAVGWTCQVLPEERAAFDAEIGRLQGDNAALKKELLSHNLPLPAGIRPDRPSNAIDNPHLQVPSDQEIDRMMSVFEKVWRRLVDMIVNMQKDLLKKS